MNKVSRRKFLEAGTVASVAVISGSAGMLPILQPQGGAQKQGPAAIGLDAHERDLLRIAMDEIIPAGDGMPAASEAGRVDYLDERTGSDAKASKDLRESLDALAQFAQSSRQVSFTSLAHEQRVELLTAFEKQNANAFRVLRNFVYEAYYTQPAVWELIGYELYPTDGPGPGIKKTFDESVLAEVRKKPKGYVEVR